MNLFVNELIELIGDEGTVLTTFRILWINLHEKYAFVIEINDPKSFPVQQSFEYLEQVIATSQARILKVDPFAALYRPEDDIPEKHREFRNQAWEIIAPIVDTGEDVFWPCKRGSLINEAIERTGKSKVTIYKYLRCYWFGGQKPNALLPHYDNCGGKGQERQSRGSKLGRPSKRTVLRNKPPGINITPEIRQIIVRSAKLFYEKQGRTLKDAYQKMLEECFSSRMKDCNGVEIPILFAEEECPTLRQFQYWYYKDRDIQQALINREGQHRFNQRYRDVLGNSNQLAPFPGALYQIDSTIADIYLVSSLDRSRIIGRPVLYIVSDVFTRMIVGFSASLEGPSWLGAALALENATTDKTLFCKEYNVEITTNEWPSQHLCKALLTDRGSEYLSGYTNHLKNTLDIDLCHTPAYRPDWKAIVERHFRLINDEVIHWEPGSVQKKRERGDKDYRLDAIYTLDEFRRIMILLILFYNNYYWLGDYPLTQPMIEDGVDPVPVELWEWGISNYGRPRKESQEIVRLNLLPSADATVTRQGILFGDRLRYTCHLAVQEHWFIKAQSNGSWRVPIAYDPRRPQNIYLRLDGGRRLETCSFLPASKAFSKAVLEDVLDYSTLKKMDKQSAKFTQRQAKAKLNANIGQMRQEAAKQTNKAADGQTSRSRVRGIRDARKEERTENQQNEAWILGAQENKELLDQEITSYSTQQETDEEYVPAHNPIEKLRKSRDRRLINGET